MLLLLFEFLKMELKRDDLTLKRKVETLQLYDKLPKMSQRNAVVQLKVFQLLLCKLLKNHENIKKKCTLNESPNAKWNWCGKDQEIEIALKLWFANVCERDACIDGPLLHKKVEDLASKLGKENFVTTEEYGSSIGRKGKTLSRGECTENEEMLISHLQTSWF